MTFAISGREISRLPRLFELFATACLFLFSTQILYAQQPREKAHTQTVIQRIEIIGNRRVQSATIRAHLLLGPGDPYSVKAVRRDAQALRNTGFFSDVTPRVEDSPDQPNAKIVMFYVFEKPIIRRIEYKGITSITESDIRDAFKDKKVGLSVGRTLDQAKLTRGVAVIKGLLAARGHQFATVKPTFEKIPSTNAVTLMFNIDEGPKTQNSTNLP